MIALYQAWRAPHSIDRNAAASALRFRSSAEVDYSGGEGWLQARLTGGLSSRSPCSLFHGWIDNADNVAQRLSLGPADAARRNPALLYDAALAAWGDDADRILIGRYCAVTRRADTTLRLVRSPWIAPPLHFASDAARASVSTVLRALFAGGHPREVDYEYVTDQLLQDHHDCEPRGWYRGIHRVPLGSVVEVGPAGWSLRQTYDPRALAPVRFARDDDYVDAARELLDRAAGLALEGSSSPGLMLSGGLDSALAATALLRTMPKGRVLRSYTFGPVAEWDGVAPVGAFGDERDFVRAFALDHPALEPHFPPPVPGGFDYGLRDVLAACDVPTANIANVGVHHAVWQAARDHGCDRLLNAELGNSTISNEAPWSFVEDLFTLRWKQLYRSLRTNPDDPRSLARRFLALPVMAALPTAWRDPLRRIGGARDPDRLRWFSLVTDRALADHVRRAKPRGASAVAANYALPRSRSEWIGSVWASADSGEDIDLGFERLYGILRRDVTGYRPLIEFCMALPTGQLRRDGESRWLARRLARGVMPEAQRKNVLRGAHNADWHARMTPRRGELREYVERMRTHPFLSETLDLDRMAALIDDWPATTPTAMAQALPRSFALTRAMTAAAFIGYAEGRNDL